MTKLARRQDTDLAKYNPERGLKTIAVAEAAETHFARAKDAGKLREAIRTKLEAQAMFVEWWDKQGPGLNHGAGRGHKKIPDRESFLPPPKVVHRWRQKLNPAVFNRTLEQAMAKYPRILEFETTAHVGQNSGENEWYTPTEYVEAARRVLGVIDLDPATTRAANVVVKAAQIFTAKDSGLKQPWRGRVWMNPPYSHPLIEDFCEKFAGHAERGEIAGIVLVNNATETTWFQRLASASMCFCFPKGRIRFWSPRWESATPLQGQVICYTGADTATFSQAFRSFGFIAERTA